MRPVSVHHGRPPATSRAAPWVPAVAVLAIALTAAAPARAQSCSYNPNQPSTASFGTIDPTLAAPRAFSITLNYKCTGGVSAVFTITGANDSGPGVYRLKNETQPTQFMTYSITTSNDPGTKITLNGLLVAADYRNAWVGNYADTLSVLVLP